MSNERTCTIPWHDGAEREVEIGTACEGDTGYLRYADKGGYQLSRSDLGNGDPHPWGYRSAVRIFAEAPEPPVKVNVPTGLGAIVSLVPPISDDPGYVLTRDGWHGLRTYTEYDPSDIAHRLRDGARVLYEGVGEDTP